MMKRNSSMAKTRQLLQRHKIAFHREAITNLSSRTLDNSTISALSKGLSFVPTHSLKQPHIDSTITVFKRKILTQFFFGKRHLTNLSSTSSSKQSFDTALKVKQKTNKTPFRLKSTWIPPDSTHPALTKFIEELDGLKDTFPQRGITRHNMTIEERDALKSLRTDPSITIKRTDKGGSITILNTTDYNEKALLHLDQPNVYTPQHYDHTLETADLISSYLDYLRTFNIIDHKTIDSLYPPNPPRTPLFYFLPKLHKEGIPPRPILSGCDSPTDRISNYVSHFLEPLVKTVPSYIQSTKDFINKINSLPKPPKNSYLVTADVSSLYTNIPINEGILAATEIIDRNRNLLPDYTPPTIVLRALLEMILQNNFFDFLGLHFKQVSGTAMGTKMAPHFAGLFMHKFETEALTGYVNDMSCFLRYIDDIFLLWEKDLPSLLEFIEEINSKHATIKLTFTYSLTSVDFLDTTIYFDDRGQLQTKIFNKPTNKNLILHYSSYHTKNIKHNLIFTETLRYRINTSEDHKLEEALITLKSIFLARGYPAKIIDQQMTKALLKNRIDLLKVRTLPLNVDNQRLLIKGQLHPTNIELFKHIKQLWTEHIIDPELLKIWPNLPICSYLKQQNLKDFITHTYQTPQDNIKMNTNPDSDSLPFGPW